MANVLEQMALQDFMKGKGPQASGGGVVDVLLAMTKEKRDKQRREQNIKDQLSTYNQMMQQMAGMPDNSDLGKANVYANDELKQKNAGITGTSNMIPTREVQVTDKGIEMKLGFKSASPTEQKSLIDIEKTRSDMAREQQKRDFLTGYVSGSIPEGAFLKEMGNLGLTPEEFESATSAKNRLQALSGNFMPAQGQTAEMAKTIPMMSMTEQPQVPEGYRVSGYKQDKFGNMAPEGIEPIPASEIKANKDIEYAEQKKQAQTDMVTESAQDTLDTIGEIEKSLKYFGAAGNVPAFPAEYEKQNWQANVEKLRSKLVVDLINKMKQASKTGATGFGQLSDKERQLLENAATALRKGLSEEDAKKYLYQIKQGAMKVLGQDVSRETMQDNDPLGIR